MFKFLQRFFASIFRQPVGGSLSVSMTSRFKVGDDHWLEGVARDPIPGGANMPIRRLLVIHFTAGATGKSSINFWKTPAANGANAHIVIDRDGTVIQCRPFNRTCGHAGSSSWVDPNTGKGYTGLNSCSIGIELANAGNDSSALSWARKQKGFGSIRAKHKHGGPEMEWEKFPEAQLQACEEVSKALVARYNLNDIKGHDDVAPNRKNDPGPAFPMSALRRACGFPA